MSNDVQDGKVREFLFRMASEAPVLESTPRSSLRRARRHLAMTAAVGVLLVGLVAYGAFSGLRAMDRAAQERPATPAEGSAIVAEIPIGTGGNAVAVGEGAVWVANGEEGSIDRIDPGTNQIVDTIDVGGKGNLDVAVGAGAVWVQNSGEQAIQRIDPKTNRVIATIPVSDPVHLGIGGGSVWTSNYGHGSVTRIDTSTNAVVATVPVPDSDPHGIAVLDDAVWVALDDARQAVRIDPATNEAVAVVPSGSYGSLVVGSGSLWGPGPKSSILRIDPVSGSVTATIDVGAGEFYQPELAAGEGSVWVAAPTDQGSRLLRIDPATNSVSAVVDVDAYIVATGEGSVWVISGDGVLVRIDPDAVQGLEPGAIPRATATTSTEPVPTPSENIVPSSDSTQLADAESLDFDSEAGDGVPDVTWVGGSLEPGSDAWLASITDEVGTFGDVVSMYGDLGPGDLRTYRFAQIRLEPGQLEVGDVFALFTDEGRYVKAEVLAHGGSDLEIRWTAFPHGASQPCWFSGVSPNAGTDAAGAAIVAQGEITLCGTFVFDLDSGTTEDGGTDIFWEQDTEVRRWMTSEGATGLVDLGPVNFDALTADDLSGLDYGEQKIVASDDADNQLPTGDVFAVRTSDGNFAKALVLAYGYDMQIRFVTYQG
jgi:YVTN family beta-propeller protein